MFKNETVKIKIENLMFLVYSYIMRLLIKNLTVLFLLASLIGCLISALYLSFQAMGFKGIGVVVVAILYFGSKITK